jgi:hypothetical protein
MTQWSSRPTWSRWRRALPSRRVAQPHPSSHGAARAVRRVPRPFAAYSPRLACAAHRAVPLWVVWPGVIEDVSRALIEEEKGRWHKGLPVERARETQDAFEMVRRRPWTPLARGPSPSPRSPPCPQKLGAVVHLQCMADIYNIKKDKDAQQCETDDMYELSSMAEVDDEPTFHGRFDALMHAMADADWANDECSESGFYACD